MEFSEVLAKRRSVRHFNAKLDVADEDIRALIEAAVLFPRFPIRQAFDRFSRMLGGEVRVPLGHRRGLVPQDLTDRPERYSGHGQMGGCGVPEIVKPEPLDPCPAAGVLEGHADVVEGIPRLPDLRLPGEDVVVPQVAREAREDGEEPAIVASEVLSR